MKQAAPRVASTDLPDTPSVCAVVVAYHPDAGFAERLRTLLPQVAALVVVDNTPDSAAAPLTALPGTGSARLHQIANGRNLGIATALNQGLEYAVSNGHQWLLTLDQDSRYYPDMVGTLLEASSACQPRPTVIGGNYFDAKLGRHKVATGPADGCLEQKTVITSGCLVDVPFAHRIGGFRDDYFIDQVDHEFCLRTRARGGRVVISRKPVMDHSVGGDTGPRVPLLGQMLPDHSALRKYYIARNSIVTIRTFWKTEPMWCLKRCIKLFAGVAVMLAVEGDKSRKLSAFAAGLRDSLAPHMGPAGWQG